MRAIHRQVCQVSEPNRWVRFKFHLYASVRRSRAQIKKKADARIAINPKVILKAISAMLLTVGDHENERSARLIMLADSFFTILFAFYKFLARPQ